MYVPTMNYFFSFEMLKFLGADQLCSKLNEKSTFSLLSPFIFYSFYICRLWGFLCLSPSRFVCFLVVFAPILEPRGFHSVPLPPTSVFGGFPFGIFWLVLGSGHWLPLARFWFPFGSLLVPFGSHLGFRWLPLGDL